MATRSKNFTENEAKIDKIVNSKPKNERIAFARKLKKMQELTESLQPIEDRIMEIIANEKQPIMDEIADLHAGMVKECVHPKELLVFHSYEGESSYVECKFCHAKLAVR